MTLTTSFNGMTSLTALMLTRYRIEFILPDAFIGLNTLKFLDLKHNELTDLQEILNIC